MPTAVTDAPYRPVPLDPPRKKWTRAECQELERAGLFEGRHYELVEGDLIDKMGKGRRHTNRLVFLMGWLIEVFGLAFINPETSIDVSPEDNPSSEPEPDLIVLARDTREITEGNPARPISGCL